MPFTFKACGRPSLLALRQRAIAAGIGEQNRGEAAFHARSQAAGEKMKFETTINRRWVVSDTRAGWLYCKSGQAGRSPTGALSAQSLTDPLDVDAPDEIQPWHGWDRDRNIAA